MENWLKIMKLVLGWYSQLVGNQKDITLETLFD